MENSNELVEHYYDKLVDNNRRYLNHLNRVKRSSVRIHEYLYKIVENNLDYLLTDSILEYIIHYGGTPLSCLKKINDDEHKRIYFLSEYFGKVTYAYSCYHKYSFEYTVLVDQDMQKIIDNYLNRLKSTIDPDDNYGDFRDIQVITYIVFAYYELNHRQDDFNELLDVFLSDTSKTLELLKMNNIDANRFFYSTNSKANKYYYGIDINYALVDYVFARLKNREIKEIK